MSKKIIQFIIILFSDNKNKEEINANKYSESLMNEIKYYFFEIISNIKRIIFFVDFIYTITAFIEIIIFWIIVKRINYIIFCNIIGNIFIFYAPIETKYPKFLFRIRMFIKEIIEGIICVFITLIQISKNKNK